MDFHGLTLGNLSVLFYQSDKEAPNRYGKANKKADL
jgi:hypothetical protein